MCKPKDEGSASVSAYRTVLEQSVMVIVGVILMALYSAERKFIYPRKGEGNKAAVVC